MNISVSNSHRLVHLDLKGAPPKLCYLEKFFKFVKEIGATGILLEWEDTFPFTEELFQIGSLSDRAQNSKVPYNTEEARHLLKLAADCGLLVIPLLQIYGHLEYVLKHDEWRKLREVENYPSSICPSNSGTVPLIRKMIKQFVEFHTNLQYIHLGADEVWHLGLCKECLKRIETEKHGKSGLYLQHVVNISKYVGENYPQLKVIIWDDMLRNISLNVLKEYNIGNFVEPMVWHYNSYETFKLKSELWRKYSYVFNKIWVASAFKGATSSCQILPIHKFHMSNHNSWLQEIFKNCDNITNFQGIALTGWSRFDHFATLCEILPCSIPSLYLCMKTWLKQGFNSNIISFVSKKLGYTDIPVHFEVPQRPCTVSTNLNFPGWKILVAFEHFANFRIKYKNLIYGDHFNTWFNQWQVRRNYTNPMHLQNIYTVLSNLNVEVTPLENHMKHHLEEYFFPHTIEEIIGTLFFPIKEHITLLQNQCEKQLNLGSRTIE